jgi:hypothetical protein
MELRGNTAAMSQVGPMTVPAPGARSYWPLAGALGLAVVVGAALLGGYGMVIFRLRHSAAGKAAVAQVRGSSQLQQMLGQPLRVHIEGGELQHQGQASLSMRVVGPHGSAQVEVEARQVQHRWAIVGGTVSPDKAEDIPLDLAALGVAALPEKAAGHGSPAPAPNP